MKYFVIENGVVVEKETDSLPAEIEEAYATIREKYIISFSCNDWADDDTDWGSGYEFDNSYRFAGEPRRCELVVRDGAVYGFKVCEEGGVLVPGECEYVRDGRNGNRYGYLREWKLLEEDDPRPADHVFLVQVPSPDQDHVFAPEDFPSGLVECVVEKANIQDNRGWFGNRARLILKLTPEAVADPDGTLAAFDAFCPRLVKMR